MPFIHYPADSAADFYNAPPFPPFAPKSAAILRNCSRAAPGRRRFPGREHRNRKIVRVLETLLSEPEDVEACIVGIDEFVIIIIALENIAGQFDSRRNQFNLRLPLALSGVSTNGTNNSHNLPRCPVHASG